MANALATLFTDIANSIRNKTGSTDKMSPSEFPSQIDSIQGGGGGIPTGYKTVTFMNGDNVLFERLVLSGDDCPDPVTQGRIETPTKESTPQYNYTFNGWSATDGGTSDSNALKNITEDKVVYSAYTSTVCEYTVTFYDEDGSTVLHTKQVAYGSIPSYTPSKDGFVFDKWTPTPVKVTGDASYTASWGSVIDSGTFGSNLTWALDSTYNLAISGTGDIPNILNNDAPWQNYIPEIVAVDIQEGVTSIGVNAFNGCTSLTSVNIPYSVTSIGSNAFEGCTSLTSVNIPYSVTSIGDRAFYCCTNLTSITMQEGVTSIGVNAFNGCTSLTSVNIPYSVTSIGDFAFRNCTSLTSIVVDNDTYTSIDGVLFNKDRTTIICYPIGKSDTEYNLPDSITSIVKYAFDGCSLTSITIPNSITSIGSNAFRNCTSLTSITIPDSVTSIGSFAFYGCTNLKNVYYAGSTTDKANITIANYNTPLTDATWHYNYTA